MIFVYFLISFMFVGVTAKITDRQYASMPTLFHTEDFDRCMTYEKEALYCFITFQLRPENTENTTEIWDIINEVSSDRINYRHDLLRHGVCITETCPQNSSVIRNPEKLKREVSKCYSEKYRHIGLKGEVVKMFCQGTESPYPIDNYSVGFAIFVVFYLIFVIFASLYEGTARYKSDEEYKKITQTQFGKFVSAFSIARNWYRLTTIDFDDPDVKSFRPLQGIRFYNGLLVILLHTVMSNLAIPIINPKFTETMADKTYTIFLLNNGFAVQTSFMISTWLLTHYFFTIFEGKREIPAKLLVGLFVNRYIRLTPLLAFVVAFHSSVWFARLFRGPFWDMLVGTEHRNCRESWWTNLLYINNHVNTERLCLPQTWSLAVDTQFFIISLVCLWFMWHNQKRIPLIIAGILGLNATVLFTVIYWNNWEHTLRPVPELIYNLNIVERADFQLTMTTPFTNLPGLAAGLAYGYAFYKYRKTDMFTSKIQVATWWILIWGLSLGIIIIPQKIIFSPEYEHVPFVAALYGSLARIIFVFAVGLGIFGMTKGIGWMMKWACEWYPTYVLGRLSYSTYLIHAVFSRVRAGSLRSPIFITEHMLFNDWFADIFFAFIAATFLTLLIELPVSELQKYLLPKEKIGKENVKSQDGVNKVD